MTERLNLLSSLTVRLCAGALASIAARDDRARREP